MLGVTREGWGRMARRRSASQWTDYVQSVVEPGERQIDIAARTGIDQTTISRWLSGDQKSITPRSVALFARGYGRPVLEAFVVAGFLTESEAGLKISDVVDPRKLSDAVLLREVQRRLLAQQADDESRDGEFDGAGKSS
jgi:transcriptional regulator with XRE-family HTH domain